MSNPWAKSPAVRALQSNGKAMDKRVARATQATIQLANELGQRAMRRTVAWLPAVPPGQAVDIPVSWREPMPVATYNVEPTWPLPDGIVSLAMASQDAAGCVVTVTAGGQAVPSGSMITLEAWS